MEKLFIYLTEQSSSFAYLLIFGILVACGLGFPLPEDIPLVAAGYLCSQGDMEIWLAVIVTMAGVLVGDTILWYLGSNLGLRFLNSKRIQILFKPKKIRRVRAYFRKYGDKIVFFARFVAGFRAVAFFMSGAMKMKFSRFIFLDALAALLSVPIWIALGYGLGYWFGEDINPILHKLKDVKHYITLFIAVVITLVVIRMYLKYQRAKGEEAKGTRSLGAATARKQA